jgi:hypothetical protein
MMDFITKKTTHQIMPLFSGLWTSTPEKPDEEISQDKDDKGKLSALFVNGEASSDQVHTSHDLKNNRDNRPLSTSSAAAVPLPSSPLPGRSEITTVSLNMKRKKKARSFTPSKVFLLKAPSTKRTDGKKNSLAASDISVHFPKIHIDRDMPGDILERLVEISNTSELDLEGYVGA